MDQVEVTKTDVEKKVERILKLIKRKNRKKEPELIGLVEEFHRQYQSLYARYEHLKRVSGEKALKGKGNESYPYYSSDPESEYYSPTDVEIETDTAFDNNRSSHRWMADNIKEELKRAYGEEADLKHKLVSKAKEKEALASDHLTASNKTHELENVNKDEVTGLKTEMESVYHWKRDLEVRIDGKTAETKQQGEINKAMFVQIPEEGDEVTKLMKQIKDNENNQTSRIDDSMTQVCNLKKEVDYLRAQQCEALHRQKTELEILLKRKSKEISQYLILVKTLKEEIARKSAVDQIMVEENQGLQVQVTDLESEVDSLCKQKIKSKDELSNIHEINQLTEEKAHLNSRILELEALFRERGLELSAQDGKSKRVKEADQMSAEVELLRQKMDPMTMEKNQVELQIPDQQRMLKEIEESTNNSKLVKQLSIGNKHNYQVIERKMEDLALEFYQKVDDNIRLLCLRIAVAEKAHYENKESYKNIKESLEQENVALKQKLATCEAEFGKLTHNAATQLNLVVNNLEVENPATRISKGVDELVSANNNRKEQLKSSVDLLVAEMDKENNESLKEKVLNSEAKGEEQTLKLLKAMSKLENRVGELEKINKEKDETLLSREEEKREAIRQLCLLIEYHRSRCAYLKELISKLTVRIKKKT